MKYIRVLLCFTFTAAMCMEVDECQRTGLSDGSVHRLFIQAPMAISRASREASIQHDVTEQLKQLPPDGFKSIGEPHEAECPPLQRDLKDESLFVHPGNPYVKAWLFSNEVTVRTDELNQKITLGDQQLTGIAWDPTEPYTLYLQTGYKHGQVAKYVYDRALLGDYFSSPQATYPQMVILLALLVCPKEKSPAPYVQEIIDSANRLAGAKITTMAEWAEVQRTLPRHVMTAINRTFNLKARRFDSATLRSL